MNIHYLERPFRCDSCSVGFRTKGQLQKHERSAGHHNKVSIILLQLSIINKITTFLLVILITGLIFIRTTTV